MAKRIQKQREISISLDNASKTMPHAVEVEKSVLATMIYDNQSISDVLSLISEDRIFYLDANQKIFRTIREFVDKEPPNALTLPILIEKLRDKNQLEEIGGIEYLVSLSKMVESSDKIENMCRILIEKHMLREIIRHSLSIASKSYDGTVDVFSLLNEAEAGFFEISEHKYKRNFFQLKDIIEKTVQNIAKIKDLEVSGVPTGYNSLDLLTGGFQKSDLIIVAARPGIGKTAFALSLAYNIAYSHQRPVGFFSLEMKDEQIVTRLLSQASRIDVSRVRTGRFTKEEETRLTSSIRNLSKLHIYIDDTPAITLHELRAKARKMISEEKVEIIFVDYLQLMQGPANAESREREISFISRGLKSLAKELDIPIVALAQLNRQVEIRQIKRPMLSDLRESGAIEQDADIVCFLHRPDLYAKKSEEQPEETPTTLGRIIELIIAKQRNGPTGELQFVFLPQFTRFEEYTTYEVITSLSSGVEFGDVEEMPSTKSKNKSDYIDDKIKDVPF